MQIRGVGGCISYEEALTFVDIVVVLKSLTEFNSYDLFTGITKIKPLLYDVCMQLFDKLMHKLILFLCEPYVYDHPLLQVPRHKVTGASSP